MKNIKILSEMKKVGQIEHIFLNFVVNIYNYQEMITFQQLVNELEVCGSFWEYRKWGASQLDKKYEEVAIFEPTHPEYNKFVEVIKNDIFKSPNCMVNTKLKPLNLN